MGNGQSHGEGENVIRIITTIVSSADVLGTIVNQPGQHKRLLELVQKLDFLDFIKALTSGRVEPSFFPTWISNAGGYFPKFAQVLSVRADLIHDPEILAGLSRCLEDMPARSIRKVKEHLLRQGWSMNSLAAVGRSLAAGTVAQVNMFTLPDGTPAVVKVAWPDTKKKMKTDFRLFSHVQKILKALQISNRNAETVAAMFDAVEKSEPAVMAEFDLQREAAALRTARLLCATEWGSAYQSWQAAIMPSLRGIPPHLAPLAVAGFAESAAWSTEIPEPLDAYCSTSVMAMSFAGGESLHQLLQGAAGQQGQQEAAAVLISYAVPFIGWLLLCKSSSHLAHVDPHPGNFRWDFNAKTMWVLDWGSHITLSVERRRALCFLVTLVADDAEDDLIAEAARNLGIRGNDNAQIAMVIRSLFNASPEQAAQDTLNNAAGMDMLQDISHEVVPVVRCLSILGGMLQKMQQKLQEQAQVQIPLSLAGLWAPFAQAG